MDQRIKLLLRTISTGIVLGLVSLAIWLVSFRMLPSSPQADITKNKQAISTPLPKKSISQSQINFGQSVQAFILPISQANYLPIRNFNIADPEIDGKAAGLFDIRSEKLLYSKNVNEKLPIASITKLMTAIVIMENLPLNDIYTVSAEDINVDGKGADLVKDELIRGSDLLKIMLIKSSNDAALAFVSNATERNINIISKMNEKAGLLNMKASKFTDPAGLDDGNSFSTITDLIKLVQYVNKYPVIWEILSAKTADVTSTDGKISHHLVNTNILLGEISGIIGGKTGYTDGALETMVLEVKIDDADNKILALVLGSNDRFGEIKKLIDWGIQAYSWK